MTSALGWIRMTSSIYPGLSLGLGNVKGEVYLVDEEVIAKIGRLGGRGDCIRGRWRRRCLSMC